MPDYQRGYRRGELQVRTLLNDLYDNASTPVLKDKDYCLQPIVVKLLDEENARYELVDGQQRLTTIYILLSFLNDKLNMDDVPYLLALLINQLRKLSTDSAYPVNFLLFDYKGEFSDSANDSWLELFDTDRKAILNPIDAPLPFNPFKDFEGKTMNEITLYATTLATALCAISKANFGANMEARLQKAISE